MFVLAAALEKTMHDPIQTLDADAACCCRGCGLELGVAVVLTWLTRCSQVQPLVLLLLGTACTTAAAPEPAPGGWAQTLYAVRVKAATAKLAMLPPLERDALVAAATRMVEDNCREHGLELTFEQADAIELEIQASCEGAAC